jgi:hypothetical protein
MQNYLVVLPQINYVAALSNIQIHTIKRRKAKHTFLINLDCPGMRHLSGFMFHKAKESQQGYTAEIREIRLKYVFQQKIVKENRLTTISTTRRSYKIKR